MAETTLTNEQWDFIKYVWNNRSSAKYTLDELLEYFKSLRTLADYLLEDAISFRKYVDEIRMHENNMGFKNSCFATPALGVLEDILSLEGLKLGKAKIRQTLREQKALADLVRKYLDMGNPGEICYLIYVSKDGWIVPATTRVLILAKYRYLGDSGIAKAALEPDFSLLTEGEEKNFWAFMKAHLDDRYL